MGAKGDWINIYRKSLVVNHYWRMGRDWLWLFVYPLHRPHLLLRQAPLAFPGFGTP